MTKPEASQSVSALVPRDLVVAAVMDALSWMDPETAAKWRAETSYERLAEFLAEREGE